MNRSSSLRRHSMRRPRSSGITLSLLVITPSIMVRCLLRASRLQDADLAGVADHEAVGHGERLAVGDHAVAPDEAVGHARAQAADAAVLEDDGVLDLGVLDDDAIADGRVRPDEGVAEAAAGADHHRPAHRAALDLSLIHISEPTRLGM